MIILHGSNSPTPMPTIDVVVTNWPQDWSSFVGSLIASGVALLIAVGGVFLDRRARRKERTLTAAQEARGITVSRVPAPDDQATSQMSFTVRNATRQPITDIAFLPNPVYLSNQYWSWTAASALKIEYLEPGGARTVDGNWNGAMDDDWFGMLPSPDLYWTDSLGNQVIRMGDKPPVVYTRSDAQQVIAKRARELRRDFLERAWNHANPDKGGQMPPDYEG
ncbi:hypothetical protein CVS47_02834 [Microbacterium lemovicicum]|uniref:Uncharacterized protein n=1 Tax=Microbacterium lemovicicum TaxID=1072463 RepID=A0A3S9WDN4_9MICO|nr:hypothetical protein [Microbacterium lemovicicum]AZS38183.1 hypothetical protein CVS47_02834 [Microbacterium lemovicicum]